MENLIINNAVKKFKLKIKKNKLGGLILKLLTGNYIVKKGDNLSKIAKQYGVSLQELAKINKIADMDKIFIGQSLKVPGQKTVPQTSKPTFQISPTSFINANYEAAREFGERGRENIRQMGQIADQRNAHLRSVDAKLNSKRAIPLASNNDAKLQDALWKAGFYNGITTRSGNPLTYEQAVDGNFGNMSNQAMAAAQAAGYIVDRKSGTINKAKKNISNNLVAMREATHAARTGGMSTLTNMPVNLSSLSKTNKNNGRAIYIHYPNFLGSTNNAVFVGGNDVGKMLGDAVGVSELPVGHAATILISPQGEGTYYEYGRYTGGTDSYGVSTFGHVRSTTKGGNWRRKKLPNILPGETDSAYVARIQDSLPDTRTGAYLIMSFPSVNVKQATLYIENQANDTKRATYGPGNTCANGACNSILPFIEGIPEFHPIQQYDVRGYSPGALAWSAVPMSTGAIAKEVRKRANNVTIMNNN